MDIEDDVLPRVCVVTGEDGHLHWRVRYVNPAGALWVLLLFGVVPFVLARFLTRKEVEGRLPISTRGIDIIRSARRRRLIGVLTALALAAGGVVGGAALDAPLVVLVGPGLALVIWVVTAFLFSDPVGGSVEQNGRWVWLTGTHPAFNRAVEHPRPISRQALLPPE
jgi:hypothetical protein